MKASLFFYAFIIMTPTAHAGLCFKLTLKSARPYPAFVPDSRICFEERYSTKPRRDLVAFIIDQRKTRHAVDLIFESEMKHPSLNFQAGWSEYNFFIKKPTRRTFYEKMITIGDNSDYLSIKIGKHWYFASDDYTDEIIATKNMTRIFSATCERLFAADKSK